MWAQKESNLRLLSYQDSVLPLNYAPVLMRTAYWPFAFVFMVGVEVGLVLVGVVIVGLADGV